VTPPPVAGVSGAVLAGGRSRRMGRNKAWLPFGARPLIAAVLDSLRPLFAELAVIGGDPSEYAGLDAEVRSDLLPDKGPLGGIYTALRLSRAARAFCIGCDMPLAAPALIAHLCRVAPDADVVVPRTAAGYEPLHAVYGKGCLPQIEALLHADALRTDALLARVQAHEVVEPELCQFDPDLISFSNVNTQEDLDRVLALRTGSVRCGS
jgi:molybdopterin-guanine dinucleotide biosynthesis protein A